MKYDSEKKIIEFINECVKEDIKTIKQENDLLRKDITTIKHENKKLKLEQKQRHITNKENKVLINILDIICKGDIVKVEAVQDGETGCDEYGNGGGYNTFGYILYDNKGEKDYYEYCYEQF